MRKIVAIFMFVAFAAPFSGRAAAGSAGSIGVAASRVDNAVRSVGDTAGAAGTAGVADAAAAAVGAGEFLYAVAPSRVSDYSRSDLSLSATPSRADEMVARMSAAVRALGGYTVVFSVRAGEYAAQGEYAVVGDGYHLSLGDVEVFCDGRVRREVNRAVREITIDAVDASSRNILNNPARGFDFLGEGFRAELLSEGCGESIVRLTPVSRAADGIIEVTVGAGDCLPRKLSYKLGGDSVAIDILRIASSSAPLPSFEPSAFSGFEIIDFR